MEKLEEKHPSGYIRKPETVDEFKVWEKVQKWGDEYFTVQFEQPLLLRSS